MNKIFKYAIISILLFQTTSALGLFKKIKKGTETVGKGIGKGAKEVKKGIKKGVEEVEKGVGKAIKAVTKAMFKGESYCYITNNTPLTLKLSTKVTGEHRLKLTKGKHYEIYTRKIGPWKREKVLKLKRYELPTSFKFTFETEVIAYDKNNKPIGEPIVIAHFLTSKVKLGIEHPSGLSKEVRLGKWIVKKTGLVKIGLPFKKKGIKLRGAFGKKIRIKMPKLPPWKFSGEYDNIAYDNRFVDLYFDSYLEGGRLYEDQEYAFSLRPFTSATFDENPNVLRVLTYNLWLRPLFFLEGQLDRAKMLPGIISGIFNDKKPDVIGFNEVFVGFEKVIGVSVYDNLKKAMAKEGYKYTTGVVGSGVKGKIIPKIVFDDKHNIVYDDKGKPKTKGKIKIKTMNGGAVIFSRWPIEIGQERKRVERVYSECSGPDCWTAKGVVYAKINKKGKKYNLFASHLNAGESYPKDADEKKIEEIREKNRNVRKKQFAEIKDFIKKQDIPETEPVIISGDLNVHKLDTGKLDKFIAEKKIPKTKMAITLGDLNLVRKTTMKLPKNLIKTEYTDMLKNLNVTHPKHEFIGTNPHGNFLDYILVHKDYLQPTKTKMHTYPYGMYSQTPWVKWDGSLTPKDPIKLIKALKSPKGALKSLLNLFGKQHAVRFHASDHYPVLGYLEF